MVEPATLRRRARSMRREPTEAERILWGVLRNRRFDGLKFRRQVPIGPYIADFLCLHPRVLIECDGSQHTGHAYDARRDAWFEAQGFRVIRIGNAQMREVEGLGDLLSAELAGL